MGNNLIFQSILLFYKTFLHRAFAVRSFRITLIARKTTRHYRPNHHTYSRTHLKCLIRRRTAHPNSLSSILHARTEADMVRRGGMWPWACLAVFIFFVMLRYHALPPSLSLCSAMNKKLFRAIFSTFSRACTQHTCVSYVCDEYLALASSHPYIRSEECSTSYIYIHLANGEWMLVWRCRPENSNEP